ncbi:MAG: hypothetical protein MZU97_26090 [Bacillus subtilis]|nr:hypothetical protein [Bacillus subtilis]
MIADTLQQRFPSLILSSRRTWRRNDHEKNRTACHIIAFLLSLIGCADNESTTSTTNPDLIESPKESDDLIGEIAAQIKALFED